MNYLRKKLQTRKVKEAQTYAGLLAQTKTVLVAPSKQYRWRVYVDCGFSFLPCIFGSTTGRVYFYESAKYIWSKFYIARTRVMSIPRRYIERLCYDGQKRDLVFTPSLVLSANRENHCCLLRSYFCVVLYVNYVYKYVYIYTFRVSPLVASRSNNTPTDLAKSRTKLLITVSVTVESPFLSVFVFEQIFDVKIGWVWNYSFIALRIT